MKLKTTLLPFIAILCLIVDATAQDYYWSQNKKIYLERNRDAVLFMVDENSTKELALTTEKSISSLERINSRSVIARVKDNKGFSLDVLSKISNNYIPLFKNKSGNNMIPTGEIVFHPNPGVSFEEINKLVDGKLELEKEKYGTFRVFVKYYNDILDIANRIYESELVLFSHPNFIADKEKFQNDPLYPEQYYLNNTGQFGGTVGIDINAPQAWAVSTCQNVVRVAVLDDGVENHVDINARVLQGFTPTNPNGFGAPTTTGDAHGQACAGIIAATRNNNEGIAGIAPCSDIIPVNIFAGNPSTADIADAIDWAWDQGNADVLSNSWGYTGQGVYFDNIAQAIGRARTLGRGGNGSVVVFSSGNSNQVFNGVTFPANVPGVVTVGGRKWIWSLQLEIQTWPEM